MEVVNTFRPGVELIYRYFPALSDTQRTQFAKFGDLYAHWNAQINVISRKDIYSLYLHHVLHSLGIGQFIHFRPGQRILDVGTGGGFSSIPLVILFPDVEFHLVDSIGKKIKVVREVADALGLKNLEAYHMRAEQIDERYDFIVSRAVTRLGDFIPWVQNKIATTDRNGVSNGILYLKG